MHDQAERLRQLVRDGDLTTPSGSRATKFLSVTSGKGGAGKTNIAINLGLALIEIGARVAIMDADLGLANVDVLLGILPEFTLKDALEGKATMSQILCVGPGGLQVIPGGSGAHELADLSEVQLEQFTSSLVEVESLFDYIIIDTGAGISRTVISFLSAADLVLLVTTPEPTSITDAYAVAKTTLQQLPEAKLGLVVNKAESIADAMETHRKLNMAVTSFLGGELDLMGWVINDPAVPRSVRAHRPLLLTAPDSPAGRNIRALAKTIHEEMFATSSSVEHLSTPEPGISGFFGKLRRFFQS